MKKTVFLVVTVLVIAAVITILFWAATYKKAQLVQTIEPRLASISSSVSTNGRIEADRIYDLHAPFSGVIRDIRPRVGQRMRAGESILTVEDLSLQPELTAARAELDAARSELQNVLRGPTKEELDQAEAEVSRLMLEIGGTQKVLETNEWLLKRDAISRFEMEQSRREMERLRHSLEAAKTRRNDLNARYTEADRKRAESRVEAAKAKIQLLEGKIARSVIRAPANGTLYHFEPKDGAYVNAGDPVALFADLSRLRVRVFVDEPDLGQVSIGADVGIHWDAHSDESWKGKVQFVPSEVVTRGTRSVAEVLCSIDGPSGSLIPNVNVDIQILTAEGRKVLTIPRAALFLEGRDHYVWTIHDGQAVRKAIDIGRSNSSLIEVTGGISADQQVIIPGEAPLSEGIKVRVAGK